MPVYGTSPSTFSAGRGAAVWNNEVIPAGVAGSNSAAIGLSRGSLPGCLSVEVAFAANPGAFSFELQVADTDADKYYISKALVTTGLNSQFVGRVEVTNVVAKFARLRMLTLTNAVAVTAKIF